MKKQFLTLALAFLVGRDAAASGGVPDQNGVGSGIHINDTYNVLYADGHAKNVKAGRPPADGSFLWYPAG